MHLTADGQLAVIHDETLDRTTDRTGIAWPSQTMDAIREADAGATFAREGDSGFPFAGAGHRVPTLPEVLTWLPEGIGLVIEIKARAAADAVVEAVRGHAARPDGRLAVISFDEAAIERVHELDPAIRTGYLLVPGQPVEPALDLGGGARARRRLSMGRRPRDRSDAAHGRGCGLGVEIGCYVVNDPDACSTWPPAACGASSPTSPTSRAAALRSS